MAALFILGKQSPYSSHESIWAHGLLTEALRKNGVQERFFHAHVVHAQRVIVRYGWVVVGLR